MLRTVPHIFQRWHWDQISYTSLRLCLWNLLCISHYRRKRWSPTFVNPYPRCDYNTDKLGLLATNGILVLCHNGKIYNRARGLISKCRYWWVYLRKLYSLRWSNRFNKRWKWHKLRRFKLYKLRRYERHKLRRYKRYRLWWINRRDKRSSKHWDWFRSYCQH